MNRLCRFAFIALAVALAEPASAFPRTDSQMRDAARQVLSRRTALRKAPGTPTASLRELKRQDQLSIYGYTEGGFAVVARDDSQRAILGYSDSTFDPVANPALGWWLSAMEEALAQRRAEENDQDEPVLVFKPVENFMTTKWSQDSPYNFLCPEQDGQSSLTGCIATAMAQCLKYLRYPESSEGESYWTYLNEKPHHEVQLNTTFRYDEMEDSYPRPFYRPELKEPLAELLRDCGYAAHMQYSVSGSGTYNYCAAAGLTANMRFPVDNICFMQRRLYTQYEWVQTIYNELMQRRPVIYTGVDNSLRAGHAFVLTGIDVEGLVYVNWGWKGQSDGFFDLADLSVSGILGNNGVMHYTAQQQMVCGITPEEKAAVPLHGRSLWGLPSSESQYNLKIGVKDTVGVAQNLYNYHYQPFSGTIALCLERLDVPENYAFALVQLSKNDAYYPMEGMGMESFAVLNELPAAKYKAYIASRRDDEDGFWPVRSQLGAQYFLLTRSEDGTLTLSEPMTDETMGIKPTVSSQTGGISTTSYYDLNGRRQDNPRPGQMVVRRSGGKVTKLIYSR